MPALVKAPGFIESAVTSSPAAHATSFTSTALDLSQWEDSLLVLECIGSVGGGGTLNAKIEHSDVAGSGYTDYVTFAQLTDTAADATRVSHVSVKNAKRYVRYSGTVAVASFSMGVELLGVRKYPT